LPDAFAPAPASSSAAAAAAAVAAAAAAAAVAGIAHQRRFQLAVAHIIVASAARRLQHGHSSDLAQAPAAVTPAVSLPTP